MSNKHYIIPIFVPNEGCPHNCVFCDQTTITGSKKKVDADFTRNTIDKYLRTIDSHKAKVEVSFFGGTFTAIDIKKQTELLKVAKEYKDLGLIDLIHLSTRPDYINTTILDNLKLYGVDVIELGVQSLDEEVLFKSGRGHSKEDVLKASALIKKYGFILGHQIMLGLPGDNFKKDISSVKQSISMKPDIYRIYPSLVIKNTPMEAMYKKGMYTPYSLEEAIDITKILYCMLLSNKINIIRVGLQPTEEINVGAEIVSGPFHPAFRELVIGSIYSEFLRKNIPCNYSGKIKIEINGKDISKLYANGKKFFNNVKLQFNISKIQVVQDNSLKRDTFVLNLEENERKLYFDLYLASKDFKY